MNSIDKYNNKEIQKEIKSINDNKSDYNKSVTNSIKNQEDIHLFSEYENEEQKILIQNKLTDEVKDKLL